MRKTFVGDPFFCCWGSKNVVVVVLPGPPKLDNKEANIIYGRRRGYSGGNGGCLFVPDI